MCCQLLSDRQVGEFTHLTEAAALATLARVLQTMANSDAPARFICPQLMPRWLLTISPKSQASP